MHQPAARRALAEHLPALAILALFLGLSRLYQHATPPFEAPDEPAHYAYIRYLADERRLPPLVVSTDEWEQGEMHQPPLYYMLAALVAGPVDGAAGAGWREAFPRNPHAALGEPGAHGNRNAVLHAGTPGRATIRALHAARSLSRGLAAATVWMTYLLARTLFPGRRALALGAMGLLAATPQFLFIGASVSNDPLVTALSTGVLLLAARVARDGGGGVAAPLGMGLLAGLAAITKISGLAALALIPAAYALHHLGRGEGQPRRAWRALVQPLLIAGLAAAAAGGWWYVRNGLLYGDPLGMRTHHAIFASAVAPLSPLATLRTAVEALPSYWGVFGWMNVLAPEAFYLGVRALTVLGLAGLLVAGWRAWRRRSKVPGDALRAAGLAALWVLVVGGMALAWTQSSTRIQGRLLFPAAGAISCLLAYGLAAWLPGRARGVALGLAGAGLAAAALYIPLRVIGPAYAPPPRIAAEDLPADVRPLDIRYGDAVTLLGYRAAARDAAPGDAVPLTLYWRAEGPVAADYVEAVTVIGPGGERLGAIDTHPGMGLAPTSGWAAGEVLVDEVVVPVEAAGEGPVAAGLRVALYAGEHTQTLPARDGSGAALPPAPEIGRLRVAPGAAAAPAGPAEHSLEATFGGVAALRGYDLALAPGGGDLEVTLHWECLAEMPEPYTVMVHVLEEDGEPLAYGDGPPVGGALPTDYWRAGDALRDVHTVALPEGAVGQALSLRVGLYRLDTFERLPATGDAAAGDHVLLGPWRVPGDEG